MENSADSHPPFHGSRGFDQAEFNKEIERALASDAFISRRHSWVATSTLGFYKIPKAIGNFAIDLKGAESRALAEQEFSRASALNMIDKCIDRPLAISRSYSCLIYRALDGEDLAHILRRTRSETICTEHLRGCVDLLARVHKHAPDTSLGIPKNEDGCVTSVDGFDVRNFRVTSMGLKFFDPHALSPGSAEANFAKFILSVLMLNWGGALGFIPWTRFNLRALAAHYESKRGQRLRSQALNAHLLQVAQDVVRYGGSALKGRVPVVRYIGATYAHTFSRLATRWLSKHAL